MHSGLFLVGVSIAAWLRMFDYTLSIRPWSALMGLPISLWLGALVGNPLYELFFHGWGHLIANLLYSGLIWAWTRYRGKLNLTAFMLLGLLIGGSLYLVLEALRYKVANNFYHIQVPHPTTDVPWITAPDKLLELTLVYATTGLVCGWLYYRWLVAKPPLLEASRPKA